MRHVKIVVSVCLTAIAFSGCGGTESENLPEDSLDSSGSALGEAGCASGSAIDATLRTDATFPLQRPIAGPGGSRSILGDMVRSPKTYDNQTCFKARKVAIGQPVADTSRGLTYLYVGPNSVPSTKEACLATTVRAILYGHDVGPGGEFTFQIRDVNTTARWGLLGCSIDWLEFEGQPDLKYGYHVAVTARTNGATIPVDVVATKSTTRRLAPPQVPGCDTLNVCLRPPR